MSTPTCVGELCVHLCKWAPETTILNSEEQAHLLGLQLVAKSRWTSVTSGVAQGTVANTP